PAIQGHVWRTHVGARRNVPLAQESAKGFPRRPAKLRIMMPVVYTFRDHITDHAADKYIRWEVLPGAIPRIIDKCCQSIRQYLCQRAGIFMCHNASDSPCGGSVFRRKGSTTTKEVSVAVVLIRTLSAQGVLHRFDNDKTV